MKTRIKCIKRTLQNGQVLKEYYPQVKGWIFWWYFRKRRTYWYNHYLISAHIFGMEYQEAKNAIKELEEYKEKKYNLRTVKKEEEILDEQ